jgi:hypothetical protein
MTKKQQKLAVLPNEFTLGCNTFVLDTDMCDAFAVSQLEMPKILFTKAGLKSDEQRIKEKSNIMVTLHWVTSPDQTSKVTNAARNGIQRFRIKFLDKVGMVILEWVFKEVKIQAIDYGSLGYDQDGSDDHPRGTIKVEIEFDSYDIIIPKVK